MRNSYIGRPSFRPRTKPSFKSKATQKQTDALYGDNWHALSDYVRQRDGYRCMVHKIKPSWSCGVYAPPPFHHLLQAHHIIPVAKGGPNHPKNLVTLCKECHGKLHGKNLGTITARQRAYVQRGRPT